MRTPKSKMKGTSLVKIVLEPCKPRATFVGQNPKNVRWKKKGNEMASHLTKSMIIGELRKLVLKKTVRKIGRTRRLILGVRLLRQRKIY